MMKNKQRFIIVMVLTFCGMAFTPNAQADTLKAPEFRAPAWVVKFSPLALFEIPHPAFQFAFEYRVNPVMSIQHELAWMPPLGIDGIFERGEMGHGYKFKNEVRYYLFDDSQRRSPNRQPYLTFELMFRSVQLHQEGWFRMNSGNFTQFLPSTQYRNQMAFHFKYGVQFLSSESTGIYVDAYTGLGLRRYYSTRKLNADLLQGTPDNLPGNYSFVLPSISLGLRVGIGK